MAKINTILLELLNLFPRYEFEKLEMQYNANHYTKYFTGWQQLIALPFAQAGGKDSLRDIETSLSVHYRKWYHIGLKGIKRSTLSDTMQNRPYEIYEGLFYKMLEKCKSVTPKHRFRFNNPLYSLDSTVIDLCLSIFPWATFRKRKGAIKLHYLYDHSGSLPTFMTITDGKCHDVQVAWIVTFLFGYIGNWWNNKLNIWDYTVSMLSTMSGILVFFLLGMSLVWMVKTSRKIGTIWWI